MSPVKLSRDGVLLELATLGKQLASNADPNTYPAEYQKRATLFRPWLLACRSAYRRIKNGEDAAPVLTQLTRIINTGVENNRLRLIIQATRGFSSEWAWTVIDDKIVYVSKEG